MSEDLNVTKQIIRYVENLFFPNDDEDNFEYSNIAHLYIADLESKLNSAGIDVSEVVKNREYMNHELEEDMKMFLHYIEENNNKFLNQTLIPLPINDMMPQFNTNEMQFFYLSLSKICNGSLDYGMLSNRFMYDNLHASYFKDSYRPPIPIIDQFFQSTKKTNYDDETILHHLLENDNSALTFNDAQFWGNIAKQLIQKEHVAPQSLPIMNLEAIQQIYYLKCQSLGQIVDPFAFRLDLWSSLDPIHWSCMENLLSFIQNEPQHPLSLTVQKLSNNIFSSIFSGNISKLPNILFKNEQINQCKKFMANILLIDKRIPKVQSDVIPPKLVDVFQRLLAYTKLDYLWKDVELNNDHFQNTNYFKLYMRYVTLQIEMDNLKKMLIQPQI